MQVTLDGGSGLGEMSAHKRCIESWPRCVKIVADGVNPSGWVRGSRRRREGTGRLWFGLVVHGRCGLDGPLRQIVSQQVEWCWCEGVESTLM